MEAAAHGRVKRDFTSQLACVHGAAALTGEEKGSKEQHLRARSPGERASPVRRIRTVRTHISALAPGFI